jgi:hypothetical protein
VIYFLARVSSEIIEVIFNNMFEIVKRKGHGMLEGFSNIIKDERNFSVCKITPRTNKWRLVFILRLYLNLIIS